jgi:hypothetical protein
MYSSMVLVVDGWNIETKYHGARQNSIQPHLECNQIMDAWFIQKENQM